ncbi:MAG: DNA glycosylase [Armatimonadota bacterium]
MKTSQFEKIELNNQPLDLDLIFTCGQAFRWIKNSDNIWQGVVGDRLIELKKTDDDILWWRTFPQMDIDIVIDYLRLNDDVSSIYNNLAKSDKYLSKLITKYYGLRLLRQYPSETILSFICSTVNSIPKISKAIEGLARVFGKLVCEVDNSCYYAFPTIERVACADEDDLRQTEKLAFRGRNLKMVATQIMQKDKDWVESLRDMPYSKAKEELLSITGIGPKIADCVCLFSLDKDEAVPVDTHIRQLAMRLGMCADGCKTVTDRLYKEISQAFINRYGKYAGWAQQFLFLEDLELANNKKSNS